ncbi:MAG: hypothetical protein ACE5K9_02620 [Candidatus Methylomirabilales bacterium]
MEEKSAEGIIERSELEKLTATKLRELCGEKYPEIVGVSGLKKEEIIEAIIGDEVRRGLRPKTDIAAAKGQGVSDLKVQIRLFRRQRDKALAEKDRHGLREARVGIKRLKRQIRRHRKAS